LQITGGFKLQNPYTCHWLSQEAIVYSADASEVPHMINSETKSHCNYSLDLDNVSDVKTLG